MGEEDECEGRKGGCIERVVRKLLLLVVVFVCVNLFVLI